MHPLCNRLNHSFPITRGTFRRSSASNKLESEGIQPEVIREGLARSAESRQYLALLDDIEEEARAALSEGIPTDEAADAYRLPASFGEWTMFSPSYYRRAFQAWARELGA